MAFLLWLHEILDFNKLSYPNYEDWLKNLKIVLTQKKISYILDVPDPKLVEEDATEDEIATYKMWQNVSLTVKYIILASMSNELQRQHKGMV